MFVFIKKIFLTGLTVLISLVSTTLRVLFQWIIKEKIINHIKRE